MTDKIVDKIVDFASENGLLAITLGLFILYVLAEYIIPAIVFVALLVVLGYALYDLMRTIVKSPDSD